MKKSIKALILMLVIFSIIVGGVGFYASTQLKPEQVKELIKSSIAKAMPGTNVDIGKVAYSLGPSISFEIDQVNLALKESRPGGELFDVEKAVIKIPIWAILLGGGEIDVLINSPKISYFEYSKNSNNWMKALGTSKSKKSSEAVKRKKETTENIKRKSDNFYSGFFIRSKVNLRLDNINVLYQTVSNIKGEFNIAKFLVKDIGLDNSAAFEIKSKLKLAMESGQVVQSDILILGEFDTNNYLKAGALKGQVVANFTNNSISKTNFAIPNLKNKITFSGKSIKEIDLDLVSSLGGLLSLSTTVLIRDAINLKNINLDIPLGSLVSTLDANIANIDFNKAIFNLKGDAVVKGTKLTPNLSYKLTEKLVVKNNGIDHQLEVGGSLVRSTLRTDIVDYVFDGTLKFFFKTELPAFDKFDVKKIGTFYSKLDIDDLIIPKNFLEKIGTRKKVETNVAKDGARVKTSISQKEKPAKVIIPSFELKISSSNNKIGTIPFSLIGKINASKGALGTKNLLFKYGKGEILTTFYHNLVTATEGKGKANLKLKKFDFSFFRPFLPIKVKEFEGVVSGIAKGKYSVAKKTSYSFNVAINAKNGSMKGINIKDKVKSIIEKVPLVAKKIGDKDIKISEKFDSLRLKGLFKDNHYAIKDFNYIGINKKAIINGRGNIYPFPSSKVGVLNLTLTDKKGKLGKELKKNVGTSILPMRFKGKGFSLTPDFGYTVKKLAKGGAKTQGKKLLKKNTDKIVDKFLKGKNADKAKKLLKGLFN